MSGRASAARLVASESRGGPRTGGRTNDGGAGLRDYLVGRCKAGSLSAVDATTISSFSHRAGAAGVGDLALDP
eukprot:3720217-Pyramimonas_sp.AAC.1